VSAVRGQDHLEAIAARNGLEAAKHMLESGNVNAGYWMLCHFLSHRCKTR